MDEAKSAEARQPRLSKEFKEDALRLVVREEYTFRAAAKYK